MSAREALRPDGDEIGLKSPAEERDRGIHTSRKQEEKRMTFNRYCEVCKQTRYEVCRDVRSGKFVCLSCYLRYQEPHAEPSESDHGGDKD
jgi:hypothetical protein